MVSTVRRIAFALSLTLLAVSARAAAQSRSWSVCGGNEFNTCASVLLTVSGQQVTMQVWNLSGFYGSYASTIFTGIGFEGMGSARAVSGSLAMSGPVRSGNSPSAWQLRNESQVGGGVNLDVVGTTQDGIADGIASGCADAGGLPGGSVQLWQNPCLLPAGAGDPGYITLTFDIEGTWDLANTYLLVKGQNGPDGASTQCITGGGQGNCGVVPEPITIALLGTGLTGMGGMGLLRRRRKGSAVDSLGA